MSSVPWRETYLEPLEVRQDPEYQYLNTKCIRYIFVRQSPHTNMCLDLTSQNQSMVLRACITRHAELHTRTLTRVRASVRARTHSGKRARTCTIHTHPHHHTQITWNTRRSRRAGVASVTLGSHRALHAHGTNRAPLPDWTRNARCSRTTRVAGATGGARGPSAPSVSPVCACVLSKQG